MPENDNPFLAILLLLPPSMTSSRGVATCPHRTQVNWSAVQWSDFTNVQYFQQSESEEDQFEDDDGNVIRDDDDRGISPYAPDLPNLDIV